MRKLITRMVAALLLTVITLVPLGVATGQPPPLPEDCRQYAFSTEEDFVTQGPEPPDGNPIISDGDLLGANCVLCARNFHLVGGFDVSPDADLGLDAVDIIDLDTYLIAFSTELDSPNVGQFTAGDLLATNGVIIPNEALAYLVGAGYDLGLDGLQFTGDPKDIVAFMDAAAQLRRDDWLADSLKLGSLLTEFGVDIWFSIEGTWQPPTGAPGLLDGDLVSASSGMIVAGNVDLLPASVPAGIPTRGVDFGLDAVAGGRSENRQEIVFSTEIIHEGGVSFTDGDVLRWNNGVSLSNGDLVQCFEPMAPFLGLDALYGASSAFASRIYLPLILRTYWHMAPEGALGLTPGS